ncbi:hypothetical protein [Xanthobacter sp. NFH-44]|uniref:hypothetical protein n=1 Tax=unclassified Xanthobacter TaxID=2623496 RepID=UPI00351CFFDA
MYGADTEPRAEPGAIAPGVEVLGDLLDAHGAGRAVALQIKIEHESNEFGFDGIDDNPLLGAVATLLHLFEGEAERQARPVVEALPGVLLHRA